MKLQDLLSATAKVTTRSAVNEAWQKGHLTQQQMVQTVQRVLGNRGNVDLVDRKNANNGVEAIVTMKIRDFIDMFCGIERGIDRVLQLAGSKTTHDSSSWEISKADRLLHKLAKSAHDNIRSFMPKGWMIGGGFHGLPSFSDLDGNITFNIKRDHSTLADNATTYYHATLASNLPSIQQVGINPARGRRKEYDAYHGRAFFCEKKEDLDPDFLYQLFFSGKGRDYNPDIAILQVNVPAEIKVYNDPQASKGAVYFEDVVPPENIKVIFSGKVKDIPWFANW